MKNISLINKGYNNLTVDLGAQLVCWTQNTHYSRVDEFTNVEGELTMHVQDKVFYGHNAELAKHIMQNGKIAKVKEGKVSLLNSFNSYEIIKTSHYLMLLIRTDEDNLTGESNGIIEVVDYGIGIIKLLN